MSRQQASLKDFFARSQSRDLVSESSDTDPDCASVDSETLTSEASVREDAAGSTASVVPVTSVATASLIAAAVTETQSDLLLRTPNQPRCHNFPPKQCGKQKRSFNSKWFNNDKWSSWLHWEEGVNKAFCYICRNVFRLNQLKLSRNMEDAFISVGFDNWKRATSAFEQHRRSRCHQESVLKWSHYLKGVTIQAQLDEQSSVEQQNNLHCLEIIFSSIEYLARQGLPLRGHDEHQGNFYQLIRLRANDCRGLQLWMERKKAYLSHEIQDEILRIMSHQILRSILKDVSSSLWYSIMLDETVDASLTEQVSIN